MPTTQEIQDKVTEIICKQLGVAKEKVFIGTSFANDLGADSLDQVELIMEMEESFGLSIPDEEAEKIQTVGDAVKYVETALTAKT